VRVVDGVEGRDGADELCEVELLEFPEQRLELAPLSP
jgi:hypothetical protein